MAVLLFKDGDRMGMVAEGQNIAQFQAEFAELLSRMIDADSYYGDWEFQLKRWLSSYWVIMSAFDDAHEYCKRKTFSAGDLSGVKEAQYIDSVMGGPPVIEVPEPYIAIERTKEIDELRTKNKELLRTLNQRSKQIIDLQEALANRDK